MPELRIDGTRIHEGGEAYVLAEVGHNHQGDLEKAKALIHAAKECGVDAVKLQKRDNRALFTRAFYDTPYDNENSFGATYGEHREALELSREEWIELRRYARELELGFVVAAFDASSAYFCAELDVTAIKFASGDLLTVPFLRYVATFGKPRLLAHAGRDASARSRPAARTGRARGRSQALASERGASLDEDGKEARRLAGSRGRARADAG